MTWPVPGPAGVGSERGPGGGEGQSVLGHETMREHGLVRGEEREREREDAPLQMPQQLCPAATNTPLSPSPSIRPKTGSPLPTGR